MRPHGIQGMMEAMNRLAYFRPDLVNAQPGTLDTDLCIYGGSSAGVVAAVQAARMGLRTLILDPSDHLGGLTASGLGWTDFGNKRAIGGLSLEVYRRIGWHYGREQEWLFEPHVAEEVFHEQVAGHGVTVIHRQYLDGVERDGLRLRALRLLGGLTVRARMFIDATYEGDLMAAAGVPYTVGREANAQYGETLNGVQVHPKHQFELPVDPWRIPGRPDSGLLPGIDPTPLEPIGSGDRRLQAYNFRMCLSDDPARQIPFARPAGYDPAAYELLARYLEAGWGSDLFAKFDRLCVAHKTDTNNHGAVSTDFIGQNHAWAEAGYAERERIFQAHVAWQQGLHYFLANDARVPAPLRSQYARWGLASDEFPFTGGWPHQLYVREARRMVGGYVVSEHDCRAARRAEDPVGLGSYNMDSHNCRRFVRDGRVFNEGDVQVPPTDPYGISYRAIVPPRGACPNLAVPVCCSSSHIAYGSLRMEPVFMVLGQSAATAAALALQQGVDLQDLPYAPLRERLLADGQVLEWRR
jgi:hypothetical protein